MSSTVVPLDQHFTNKWISNNANVLECQAKQLNKEGMVDGWRLWVC